MKITYSQLLLVVSILYLSSSHLFAQTKFKDNRVGHVFHYSVPEYMSPASGLNDAAIAQYQSEEKDVYSFIIEDSKEELKRLDMKFASTQEFFDLFAKDFLVGQKEREVSKPKSYKVGNVNFTQADISYYDEDAKAKIYYHVTVAETPAYFYKILSYTSLANKDAVKEDLTKMANSIKEISCP